jgi:hypothetical protein
MIYIIILQQSTQWRSCALKAIDWNELGIYGRSTMVHVAAVIMRLKASCTRHIAFDHIKQRALNSYKNKVYSGSNHQVAMALDEDEWLA